MCFVQSIVILQAITNVLMKIVCEIVMKQANITFFCVFVILGVERWKNFCKGNVSVLISTANCCKHSSLNTRNPVEQSYHKMYVITVGLQMLFKNFWVM